MFGGQNFRQLVLRTIGVLILVHQNVFKAVLVFFPYFLMFFQQQDGNHQQIIKVQSIVRPQFFGIELVYISYLLLEEIIGITFHGLWPHKLVFCVGNCVLDSAGRILLGVKVHFLQTLFDDHLTVTGIVNDEVALVKACGLNFPAQETRAKGMESGKPHILGALANHPVNTVAHLCSGLVGKGNGQNIPRGNALGQKVGNLTGQHLGFPRTGAGHDEQRPVSMLHCFCLSWIKSCKYIQNSLLNSCSEIKPPSPERGAAKKCRYLLMHFTASERGGIICFLRLITPGR